MGTRAPRATAPPSADAAGQSGITSPAASTASTRAKPCALLPITAAIVLASRPASNCMPRNSGLSACISRPSSTMSALLIMNIGSASPLVRMVANPMAPLSPLTPRPP
jgi:hypothetical protein